MAYSMDLRERVVAAVQEAAATVTQVARPVQRVAAGGA